MIWHEDLSQIPTGVLVLPEKLQVGHDAISLHCRHCFLVVHVSYRSDFKRKPTRSGQIIRLVIRFHTGLIWCRRWKVNAWTFYKQGVEIISYEHTYFNALVLFWRVIGIESSCSFLLSTLMRKETGKGVVHEHYSWCVNQARISTSHDSDFLFQICLQRNVSYDPFLFV